MVKRVLDVVGSLFGLVVLSPLFLLIAVAVKASGPGPVFFGQLRVGRDGQLFRLWKFRSMVHAAEALGPAITVCGDVRVTAVGRFLRRCKLDELPQLLNVLKGEMSLVGPRPEVPRYVDLYQDRYAPILRHRPGITSACALGLLREEHLLAACDDPEGYYVDVLLPRKIEAYRHEFAAPSFWRDVRTLAATVLPVRGLAPATPPVMAERPSASRVAAAAPVSVAPAGANVAMSFLAGKRRREAGSAALGACLAAGAYLCARWAADRPTLLPIPSAVTLLVPAVRLASYYGAGLHRVWWRYASTRDALRLAAATLAGSLVLLVCGTVLPGLIPRVLLLEGVFYLFLAGVSRFGLRILHELRLSHGTAAKRVLVVGAGTAGNLVLRAMNDGTVRGYRPVGLVDDNPAKLGTRVQGVPVVGAVSDAVAAARRTGAEVVVIAIPSASTADYYRLVNAARATGLPVKSTPDLQQILQGGRAVARIEDVRMEDLLHRRPVRNDLPELRAFLAGRTVLVTGAAGSIGSELCRQVGEYDVARLICLDNNETGLFRIEHDLRERLPHLEIVPFLGDIRDRARLNELFTTQRPEIVFHAAAYKHVPMLQFHPLEAIRNNVGGTDLLTELADAHGVEAFVFISTDKAVNPTSVMGASKRIAERIVRARNQTSDTRFCVIRFGNVLGSNGSVVELFLRQIREGRPVTVTHPRIERFFMTIPEAVHLVLFAAAMEEGGETFILDMGQPVRIDRLARDIIVYAGLTPDVDVPIVYTGLRPGEKLYEELWTTQEKPRATVHPGIMVSPGMDERPEQLHDAVRSLVATAARGDLEGCWEGLLALVPTFQGSAGAQAVRPPAELAESRA